MGMLSIASRTKGDVKITWDPKNKEEVAAAEKAFDDLIAKGHLAYDTSESEEAVAEWLYVNSDPFNESRVPWGGLYDGERNKWRFLARAVRALLREKVREAVDMTRGSPFSSDDAIIARVMREEAPRG